MRRTDSQVFLFTDHDTAIVFEGDRYEPSGGISPSATRKKADMNVQQFETEGAITSDKITLDDLRKGVWRDCEVIERTVDWLYPGAGALVTSKFWIVETEWNGEVWTASVEGGTRWLRSKQGFQYTRNCRWQLGQGEINGIGCSVAIGSLTLFNVTVGVVTTRTLFTGGTSIPAGDTRERYRYGRVIWIVGQNTGFIQEIKDYTSGTRVIQTFLPTPFAINDVTDRFNLEPGCDKTRPTCIAEYNNLVDFGGFPFIPGTNQMLMFPRGTTSAPSGGIFDF